MWKRPNGASEVACRRAEWAVLTQGWALGQTLLGWTARLADKPGGTCFGQVSRRIHRAEIGSQWERTQRAERCRFAGANKPCELTGTECVQQA
jgi:hypothetical protein